MVERTNIHYTLYLQWLIDIQPLRRYTLTVSIYEATNIIINTVLVYFKNSDHTHILYSISLSKYMF